MFTKIVLSLTTAFNIHNAIAQLSPDQMMINDPDNIAKLSKGGMMYASKPKPPGIDGTPYLFEGVDAEIITSNNEWYKSQKVSYDAHADDFFVARLDRVMCLDRAKVSSISIGSQTFIVINNAYYQVIADGRITLLKKYLKTIQKGQYNPAINAGSRNDFWVVEHSYFIWQNNTLSEPFDLKKKELIRILALTQQERQQAEQVSGYRSEAEVVKLLSWLNDNR